MSRPGSGPLLTPTAYVDIIGHKNIGDVWHSQSGIALSGANVTSWTGLFRGIQLTPYSSNPTYGADGSYFKSKSVVQFSRASTQILKATLGTPIGTTSDRAELIVVGRYKTLRDTGATMEGDNIMTVFADSGYFNPSFSWAPQSAALTWTTQSGVVGEMGLRAGYFYVDDAYAGGPLNLGNKNSYDGYAIGTTPYLMQATPNLQAGTHGRVELYVNNSLVATEVDPSDPLAYVSTHPIGTIKDIAIAGDHFHGGVSCADASVALAIHCLNRVSDSQRAAIYALARSEWGV